MEGLQVGWNVRYFSVSDKLYDFFLVAAEFHDLSPFSLCVFLVYAPPFFLTACLKRVDNRMWEYYNDYKVSDLGVK